MANNSIYKYKRRPASRQYKRKIVIAPEGQITEVQYFNLLKNFNDTHVIEVIKPKTESAPTKLLRQVKKYLKEYPLQKNDEAWIVVDKDSWTDEQIQSLIDWMDKQQKFVVISNPKIEVFLLAHYEDFATTSSECDMKIKKYIKGYDKHIPDFSLDEIKRAVQYCKKQFNNHKTTAPDLNFWDIPGTTNIFELIEKIICIKDD